jgi:HEAT repeat protein
MTTTKQLDVTVWKAALNSPDAEVRHAAAMRAGTTPDPEFVVPLLERCAVEREFFIRDLLTWALIHQDRDVVTPLVVAETTSTVAWARSQALHTLSKLADPATWSAITPDLIFDADDEVAKTAWRAAVARAPEAERPTLARQLVTLLGRGDHEVQRSLSRALAMLGEVAVPVIELACASEKEAIRVHAQETLNLIRDPDAALEHDIEKAKRAKALHQAPGVDQGLV